MVQNRAYDVGWRPMMSHDLSEFLDEWPREQGTFQVREVQGDDGRPLIQVRIDMGIAQMEVEGRPDGNPSILDRLEHDDQPMSLDPETCHELRSEAILMHHRYVALFQLKQFGGVVRDVRHNLRILDVCGRFAQEERDRTAMEHLRPQILTMGIRADAESAVARKQKDVAREVIDRGLAELTKILGPQGIEHSNEVQLLRGMRDLLVRKLPPASPPPLRVELEQRLAEALEKENYELAAILRDEVAFSQRAEQQRSQAEALLQRRLAEAQAANDHKLAAILRDELKMLRD